MMTRLSRQIIWGGIAVVAIYFWQPRAFPTDTQAAERLFSWQDGDYGSVERFRQDIADHGSRADKRAVMWSDTPAELDKVGCSSGNYGYGYGDCNWRSQPYLTDDSLNWKKFGQDVLAAAVLLAFLGITYALAGLWRRP